MSDNPTAFPVTRNYGGNDDGLTMRDYFAAKAMQALLTNSMIKGPDALARDAELLAWSAYKMADAMMSKRARNA